MSTVTTGERGLSASSSPSPLEAARFAWGCPVDLTTDERAVFAYLASRYPKCRPPFDELLAVFDKMSERTLKRHLASLRGKGLLVSITVGRGAGRTTWHVLNVDGQVCIPPEIDRNPKAEHLMVLAALADADSQSSSGPSRFECLRRMLAKRSLERPRRLTALAS